MTENASGAREAASLDKMYADIVVISELRGDFPAVAFFDDVDLAELTAGDSDPVYLTIPIGKADVTSGNGNYYSADFLSELERQVRDKRPTGQMGHESDDPMTFPPEAIFWVGAQRIGELLWGKGYLPSGAARDRIRRYKAANKTIGTSILASSRRLWNAARNALEPVLDTFDLHRIDIGPVEKLGVRDLSLVPILTREMLSDETATTQEDIVTEKTKHELLQELRSGALPAARRNWQPAVTHAQAEIHAVRELLGVDATADVVAVVAEMRQAQDEQAKAAIKTRITELVSDAEKGVKVESVRGLITELVVARNPQTLDDVDAAYQQVIEMQSVQDTLAASVRSKMGPPQRVPVGGKQGAAHYFNIPQEA